MIPLTVCCLTMAFALGLGTGVVGAAGGLGGFFPPLVMGVVKTATGGYAVGFLLRGAVALACLVVLAGLNETGSPQSAVRIPKPAGGLR